jgi:NAD(P)-dependent dehydrogenase (short-subunit alcohol dehydrogenase family)
MSPSIMELASMDLEQRVAIVTGSGAGLGRAHALMLARYNARVVVNDLSAAAVESVVDEIREGGGTAIGCQGSVADLDAVSAMVRRAERDLGPVDILVNNAGILRDRSFAKMSIEDFRTVVDVHLMGSVHCTKLVWEGMRSRQYGRVLFTTSSSGLYGNFGQANYAAAKMALVGLMQTLALEGERHGIRVNCLAPSAATGMTEDLYPPEVLDALGADAVSPAVVALCSPMAPTRTILLAGAGGFSQAHISMTRGIYIDPSEDVALSLASNFALVGDREGEAIPVSGVEQHRHEVARFMSGRRQVGVREVG